MGCMKVFGTGEVGFGAPKLDGPAKERVRHAFDPQAPAPVGLKDPLEELWTWPGAQVGWIRKQLAEATAIKDFNLKSTSRYFAVFLHVAAELTITV